MKTTIIFLMLFPGALGAAYVPLDIPRTIQEPRTPSEMRSVLVSASKAIGADPLMVVEICTQESNLRPYPGDGGAGERGPCQILEATAKQYRCKYIDWLSLPSVNADCAALIVKKLDRKYKKNRVAYAYHRGSRRRMPQVLPKNHHVRAVMTRYWDAVRRVIINSIQKDKI